MKKIVDLFLSNLIFIIPALIICLIAYVHLAPDKPVKPCASTTYIVVEVTNPGQVYSGKVKLRYRYIYRNQVSNESITLHYTNLPPEDFDRFYMLVCVRDSTDTVFDIITDSIPVKPYHRLGVEYPADSVSIGV
jgi:hypothetical protein